MKKALILLVGIAFTLVGCGERVEYNKRIEVVRIFMHQPDHYSFLTEKQDSGELIMFTVGPYFTTTRFFRDVPENSKMWVRVVKKNRMLDAHYELEIHVRSEKDIGEGGWDRGKLGRGKTSIVE